MITSTASWKNLTLHGTYFSDLEILYKVITSAISVKCLDNFNKCVSLFFMNEVLFFFKHSAAFSLINEWFPFKGGFPLLPKHVLHQHKEAGRKSNIH